MMQKEYHKNLLVNVNTHNAPLALLILCFLGTFLTEFVSNTACGAILAANIFITLMLFPL